MLNNVNTNVEHIIAKIDNDFNIDQSDWIPRVPAWIIAAMSELNVLRKGRKKIKLTVCDKIAISNCPIDSPNLIVTDCKGCVIDAKKSSSNCNDCSSTGKQLNSYPITPSTVSHVEDDINRYNTYPVMPNNKHQDYVLIGNNQIELSFNTDYIYIETDVVETFYSERFEEDLPVIPNVGLLIEAIGMYCMTRMLYRGYKHPVFNLGASQYGTNPYYEWNKLKNEAKRAVIIDAQGNINVTDGNAFQSAFFITTFK